MYIVTISRNFKISTNSDNLFFRGNTTSIPLSEEQLKNLMLRCKCYRFRDQLFSCKTETPIGRIIYDDKAVVVELEPIEEVVKPKRTKIIKTTLTKPIKPAELVTYKEAEKMLIERALIYSNGVQDRASKLLGVCTRTVRDRIKKYNIEVDLTKLVESKDITTIEEMERFLLVKTLKFTRGNKQGSARLLGISRRGLEYKMNRLGIDAECYLK